MASIFPRTSGPDDEFALRRAIEDQPDAPHAHAAFASYLCAAGRADEALTHLDHAHLRHPSLIWPLSIKAGILSAERRAVEAIEVHEALVAMAPDIPIFWSNYASDLSALGMSEDAGHAYRKAIERAPELGTAWLGLANLRGEPFVASDIAAMENGLQAAQDPYQQIQLQFALGRALGDVGAFKHSFEYYSRANSLRDVLVPYGSQHLAAHVQAHQALPPLSVAANNGLNRGASQPIFIVGMPRSGSTLIEQMLAGHPDVEALGELFALRDVAKIFEARGPAGTFRSRLETMDLPDAQQLGQCYLDLAARYRKTSRRYFTDKMPANWQFIALIHRILPEARVIDVRREPMACCFSAFTTYFNRHTDFPNRLGDLGRHYREYLRMMDAVGGHAAATVYRLDYARLVTNTASEISALLDFLRLPFAATCLTPEKTSRAIYTPSAQQVRTPIFRTNDDWQNYMPWLSPLQAALYQDEEGT